LYGHGAFLKRLLIGIVLFSGFLALIETESLEYGTLFFPDPKERPAEAPFGSWKKSVLDCSL
jgi:hypothetical protein